MSSILRKSSPVTQCRDIDVVMQNMTTITGIDCSHPPYMYEHTHTHTHTLRDRRREASSDRDSQERQDGDGEGDVVVGAGWPLLLEDLQTRECCGEGEIHHHLIHHCSDKAISGGYAGKRSLIPSSCCEVADCSGSVLPKKRMPTVGTTTTTTTCMQCGCLERART